MILKKKYKCTFIMEAQSFSYCTLLTYLIYLNILFLIEKKNHIMSLL